MPARDRSTYKMVLVVRGELRLTAGKAAVQIAHAAVLLADHARRKSPAAYERWTAEGQKKVALVVETLAELQAIERRARAERIPSVLVEDAGLTEVAPGTRTVLGLGPARPEALDPITGDLALL